MHISSTVDQARLEEARRRMQLRDSELLDAALGAMLDKLDAEAEVRALEMAPYGCDPKLVMPFASEPGDDYSGVPERIQGLDSRACSSRPSLHRPRNPH